MMMLLVVVLYMALLYCTWGAIVQAERVCMLKCSRAYDRQKRRRLVVAARNRLLLLIACMMALAVAITAAVGVGTVIAW